MGRTLRDADAGVRACYAHDALRVSNLGKAAVDFFEALSVSVVEAFDFARVGGGCQSPETEERIIAPGTGVAEERVGDVVECYRVTERGYDIDVRDA